MAGMEQNGFGDVPSWAIRNACLEELLKNKSVKLSLEKEGPFNTYFISGNIRETYYTQQLYLECSYLMNKRIKVGPAYSMEFTEIQILRENVYNMLTILRLTHELKLTHY